MLDVDLIVDSLRANGHVVESTTKVPENAGGYEFVVDGRVLNLDETRALLEADAVRAGRA